MTKQELLGRILEARAEVAMLCARFSLERLDQLPGPKPDWTAKDLIAHLSFWEHPTLDRLAGRNAAASWGDVHAINADLLRKSRERSAADVLLEFTESGARVLQEIEPLSDEDLMRESPWKDGKTLGDHVADDTCVHYEEHLPALRAWAEKNR